MTFSPVADATIKRDYPTSNHGGSSVLASDGTPVEHFLMRYAVSGTAGYAIRSAKLRLYVANGGLPTTTFYPVADNSLSESAVAWNSAPAAGTTAFGTLDMNILGSRTQVDASPYETGDGIYSLRAVTSASDSSQFSSRHAPQLVVTY